MLSIFLAFFIHLAAPGALFAHVAAQTPVSSPVHHAHPMDATGIPAG